MRAGWVSVALLAVACGGAEERAGEPPEASSSLMPPMRVTREEFARLRWLEGTWRGSGEEQPTFYERYAFVDDSTIRAESSPDSTFPNAEEAGAIELRQGRVATGGGDVVWAVSSLDERSVRFDPVRGARNTFVWRSESDSVWTATLSWRDDEGVAHELVYTMRRMP